MGQGYLFSRPLAADATEALLRRRRLPATPLRGR
jgi:EAL domain-containing protein (putative c-di-GMP-specific phosphodiesterase class I)